jgi:hypothetical protein
MSEDPKVPKLALRAIIIVLVVLALLSIYANIQRWRRSRLETVVFIPVEKATPSPTASP